MLASGERLQGRQSGATLDISAAPSSQKCIEFSKQFCREIDDVQQRLTIAKLLQMKDFD